MCSMRRKWLQRLDKINKFWKAKAEYYYRHTDDVPATNSEDSMEHICTPTNVRATTTQAPPKSIKVSE